MFRHWFTDTVGIATFAGAIATVLFAVLVVRFVCRRYSSRASLVLVLAILGASLFLPWLSWAAAGSAASPPSRIARVRSTTFVRELDAGKVRHLAAVAGDAATDHTVFETSAGRWRQTSVAPSTLTSAERSRAAKLAVTWTRVPARIQDQFFGPRNAPLVAFLSIDMVVLVASLVAVASVVSIPRRVDLDRALQQLLAEHHGHEIV